MLVEILNNQIKPDAIWEWGSAQKSFLILFKNIDKLPKISEIEQFYISTLREAKKSNASVIIMGSEEFPVQLYSCDDPPLVLYVQGDVRLLSKEMVAVVGSRKMTGYGALITKTITRQLVGDAFVIVSGCMYGVDECAHREALSCRGKTVAVLGYGFEHAYPERMRSLRQEILLRGGAVVSEYAPATEPRPGYFVERNRIIAGLSKAVVVTEAAQRSGSHSTAICAAENGRAIFAVPGAITNPYSEGTKWLINQGATLLTSGYEVAEVLGKIPQEEGLRTAPIQGIDDGSLSAAIARFVNEGPATVEQLAAATEVTLKEVLIAVAQMEIRGELVKDGILWYLNQ